MERLKIEGIASEEYPGGRLDTFRIELPKKSPHHSHVIPLFLDLGFPKEEILDKLDVIFQEIDYLFFDKHYTSFYSFSILINSFNLLFYNQL